MQSEQTGFDDVEFFVDVLELICVLHGRWTLLLLGDEVELVGMLIQVFEHVGVDVVVDEGADEAFVLVIGDSASVVDD